MIMRGLFSYFLFYLYKLQKTWVTHGRVLDTNNFDFVKPRAQDFLLMYRPVVLRVLAWHVIPTPYSVYVSAEEA